MAKYYDTIAKGTHLRYHTGSALVVSSEFRIMSSKILSQCVFLQSLIQQIIYTSHGDELIGAKRTLKSFPSPKARVDFLCSFPYSDDDPIISRMFDFSRTIFKELYELRNILSHEIWSSSEDYPGSVLFSTLDENSRLQMASGKLWYEESTVPQDIYDATIRFIRSVKVISHRHLRLAIADTNTCSWSLMHINNILNEKDPQRRADARQAFLVFRGTSHLFDAVPTSSKSVEFSSSRRKRITGTS